MKATGLARLAKTEAGGLALDLYDEDELRQSYRRMLFALGDAMVPAVVQAMAAPGDDVRVRVRRDPLVGAVIGVGRGGAGGPEPDPAAARILPLTDFDAERLAATVLPPESKPAAALTDLLLRLSALVDDVPELATIDLNPVIVSDDRAAVTDAAVDLAAWHPDPMSALRRL
jgi:hypothetical protein